MKHYDKAIDYYSQSLAVSEKLGDKYLTAANLVNMGNVYEMTGDYVNAIALNRRGLELAQELQATEIVVDVYANLAEEYAKAGKYDSAYRLHKQYVALKDSVMNTERAKVMAEMQAKYETELKEKQALQQRHSRTMVVGWGAGIAGILVILYLTMKGRRKR